MDAATIDEARQCAKCGTEFTMRTYNQMFCSDECYKSRSKRPVEDRAREIIRDRVANNEPVRARAVAEEHGISHVMMETAAAIERAVRDERERLLLELNVDPKKMSMTAQQKLDTATKNMRKEMEAEYRARWQREIHQHIERLKIEALPRWKEDAREAHVNREHYARLVNNHKFPLTKDEWRMLNMVVHPDSNPSPEVVSEASRLLIERKLPLCGEK